MSRYIAFLRGINVGGHTVKMDELRRLFEELRFSGVETFIASGNVIFETRAGKAAALERKIEKHLNAALGYEVATFLRTPPDVAAIAAYQPFKKPDVATSNAFNIAFLKAPLSRAGVNTLMGFTTDIDEFCAHDREVYWLCQKKQSESTFSNAVFEKALGIRATFRGRNTLQRLAAKYPPVK